MNPGSGIVLSLCDRSAVMVRPWADAGYRCICVDTAHDGITTEGGITFIGEDVRNYLPPREAIAIVFAFAPCTNLAGSGARWFKDKGLRALYESLELVERCRAVCEWSDAPWMLENPVGTLSTYWRKPDFLFDPCDYAGYLDEPIEEAYTKRTCLWTGGGFVLPRPCPVVPVLGSKMHTLPPTAGRAMIRSETPAGFARAVFLANGMEEMKP
jgi:hypothetical protein